MRQQRQGSNRGGGLRGGGCRRVAGWGAVLGAAALLAWGCADETGGSNIETLDLADGAGDAGGDVADGDPGDGLGPDATSDTSDPDTTDPDAGSDAADGDADVEPVCAYEGDSCPSGTQCCDGTTCVDDGASTQCARTCSSDVQCGDLPGTACRRGEGVTSGPMYCLPELVVQCEACSSDADCASTSNRCVELGGAGGERVCLQGCSGDADCAGLSAGTTCQPRTVNGQFGPVTVNLCVPQDEVCACNDPDGDGYGTGPGCPNVGIDCAPMDGQRHPGAVEVCNELDDNCDGNIDEGWDKNSDLDNCGTCGTTCTATGGTAVCQMGQCGVACSGTLADCDSDPTTCETDIGSSMQHCGACNVACTSGAGATGATCSAGVCEVTGCVGNLLDCNGVAADGCEVDPLTNVQNCGGCGITCSASGGAPVCNQGSCEAACSSPFDDCDSDPTTCETNLTTSTEHCLVCGNACTLTGGATSATCGPTGCRVASCSGTLVDCDGQFLNGCEVDTTTDPNNCLGCGNVCYFGPNTIAGCSAAGCVNLGCAPGFADCNQNPADGCEINVQIAGACVCQPGEQRSCWTGDSNQRGVGECRDGIETCSATGMAYGPCLGQVLPTIEICGNGLDEDCTGVADDVFDIDGDGFTRCQNDCCETTADGCAEPAKVNPRAYDAPGNNLDDNCDGIIDNPPATACSTAANFSAPAPLLLAQAMDICETTTANGPGYGLVSATLSSAVANHPLNPRQYAVIQNFGTNVLPTRNGTMAILSSGAARDANDPDPVNPNGTGFQDSVNIGPAPADYLAAHGGVLQTVPGCPNGNPTVRDMAKLSLVLRAPSNAQGFEYRFKFYSAEYPEWLCNDYNDFFLAMLYSNAPGIPADKNISFDVNGNPVSVNNAFFEVCQGCPLGTTQLEGTNFPVNDAGGTAWLTTTAPVVPGELFELVFYIWDTGDHAWDSSVLLDNFQWRLQPTTVSTND